MLKFLKTEKTEQLYVLTNVKKAYIFLSMNRKTKPTKKYIGTYYDKGRYDARLTINKKLFRSPCVNSEKAAARLYDQMRLNYLDEESAKKRLNFPNSIESSRNYAIPRKESQYVKKNATCKYIGVSWDANVKKYFASIFYEGERHFLGRFDKAKDAAKAYDEESFRVKGESSKINFPDRLDELRDTKNKIEKAKKRKAK